MESIPSMMVLRQQRKQQMIGMTTLQAVPGGTFDLQTSFTIDTSNRESDSDSNRDRESNSGSGSVNRRQINERHGRNTTAATTYFKRSSHLLLFTITKAMLPTETTISGDFPIVPTKAMCTSSPEGDQILLLQ